MTEKWYNEFSVFETFVLVVPTLILKRKQQLNVNHPREKNNNFGKNFLPSRTRHKFPTSLD